MISFLQNDTMLLENTHKYLFPRSEFYNIIRFTVDNFYELIYWEDYGKKCVTGKDRDIQLDWK
jgi:hypothetical protein